MSECKVEHECTASVQDSICRGENALGRLPDGSVQLFVQLVLSGSLREGHCHSTVLDFSKVTVEACSTS